MFSTAEKTVKSSPAVQQKTAGTSFFRKAGEEGFFGNKETSKTDNAAFFNAPVQAKLKVSSPDDPQEKEADAVAEQVMRMPEPVVSAAIDPDKKEEKLSRKEEKEVQVKLTVPAVNSIQTKEEPEIKLAAKLSFSTQKLARQAASEQEIVGNKADAQIEVNRKNDASYPREVIQRSGRGSPPGGVPFEQTLAASKGGGSAMPDTTRQFMESRFQADFSRVRIHTGTTAENLSSSIQAQAFAHGNDIYFNQGKFSPDSTTGRTLLAHELTHTIQQGASKSISPARSGTIARACCSHCKSKDWSHLSLKPFSSTNISRCCHGRSKPEVQQKDTAELNNLPPIQHTPVAAKTNLSTWQINPQGNLQSGRKIRVQEINKVDQLNDVQAREAPDQEQALANAPPVLQKQPITNPVASSAPTLHSPFSASRQISVSAANTGSLHPSATHSSELVASRSQRGPPVPPQSVILKNTNKQSLPEEIAEEPTPFTATTIARAPVAGEQINIADHTHTGIQRGPEPAEAAPEESFLDKLKSGFDATLKLILPANIYSFYLKIKQGGILHLIKDTLVDLIKGLFSKTGLSDAEIQAIFEIFATLKTQLPVILSGLLSGDCKPLFEALDLLAGVVSTLAGRVWDNLMAELEPIRLWLISIWETFGTPVIEEITAFAGEQWKQLKALGSFIWESFRPIREQGEEVWNWVVEKLGFGSSDETGLLGYISGKLSEAWDSIKAELKPVIAPINDVIAGIKAIASLEAIRTLQEDAKKWLNEVAKTATAMGSDEDAVANKQLTLRQVLLPSLNKAIDRLKSVLQSAADWVVGKVEIIATHVNGFVRNIQSNTYLSPVYSLIQWVPTTVASLQEWATSKVMGLFSSLQNGADYLKAFFEPVLQLLEKLVTVAGNLLKYLPDLILGVPFMLMPRCIKDPIIKWLTEVVLKQIPIISEFISLTEKWEEIKTAALTVLKQVFLDGQLAKGLWTYFKTLMGILGIDPQLVTKVVAKAAQNFSDIISKPGAFLKNIWTAIKGGFSLFFDHIWTHLPKGALDWLFGEVKGATKVAPPKDFEIGSILGFVLELFGITKENVYDRMSKNTRIGPEGVKKIREMERILTGALEWITVWIKEGPDGLLKKIKKEVGDLKNMVINSIVSWITTRVTAEITKRLLTSADPLGIGATLNTIKLVYDTMKTAVAYINRMLNMVNSVMDSTKEIISGNTKAASEYLEGILAKAVPFVVGFAVEVIIGPVGEKIKDIVGGVRKKIDAGIDALINGALNLIKSLVETGKKAVETLMDWLGLRNDFKSKDGADHYIFFKGSELNAVLMVASNDPKPVEVFLNAKKTKDPDANTASKYFEITVKPQEVKVQELHKVYKSETDKDKKRAARYKHQVEVQTLRNNMKSFSELLAKIPFDEEASDVTIKTKITQSAHGNSAGNVKAWPLTYLPGDYVGGPPSQDPPGWKNYAQRASDQWARGHLLSEHLHGPGLNWNLTPVSESVNSNMKTVENKVKPMITQQGKLFYYSTTATYKDDRVDPNERSIPVSISIVWGTLKKKEGTSKEYEPVETHNEGPFTQGLPTLSGPPNLNSVGSPELVERGITRLRLAESIIQCKNLFLETYGGFSDYPDLIDKMSKFFANQLTPKTGSYPKKRLENWDNSDKAILNKVFVIDKTVKIEK